MKRIKEILDCILVRESIILYEIFVRLYAPRVGRKSEIKGEK
jgi:hypothetical protein